MVHLTLCWNCSSSERFQGDSVHRVWQSSATKPQQTELPLSHLLSVGLVSFHMNRYNSWNPVLSTIKPSLPSSRTDFNSIQRTVKRQENSHRKKLWVWIGEGGEERREEQLILKAFFMLKLLNFKSLQCFTHSFFCIQKRVKLFQWKEAASLHASV